MRDDQKAPWGCVCLVRKEEPPDRPPFAVAVETLDEVSVAPVLERAYLDAVGDTAMLACKVANAIRGAVGMTIMPAPAQAPAPVVVRGRTSAHRGAIAKRVRRVRRSR